ncbi:MAG: DUF3299 domain-containing protein [Geminicoccaceae bacterium]
MRLCWLALAALFVLASPTWAAKEPKVIAWPDLMPQTAQPMMPEDLEFGDDDLSNDQAFDPDLDGVMEHGMTPAPDLADTASVVEELNDVQVKIAGYVLPLDFEATEVKEFLLVPYVGACIHVPPPPPNQIIYVTSEEGIEVGGMFEPMWITGTLQTASLSSDLADVGYMMTLDRTDPYEY